MTIGRFLAGIFTLIWSPKLEKYLILQRAADRDHAPGVWESVTGRVDQGENFEQALHREAEEELGVDVQLEFILGTVHFYRGPKTPEYEMVGLVCFCTLDDPQKIQISAEHSQYRWVDLTEVAQLLRENERNAGFIHHAIQRAEAMRKLITPQFMDYLHRSGMEVTLS
jgi:8-oxo-dGTP diphosphatase